MSGFSTVNFISLQQPLIMLASMLTGKDVAAILAMEINERAVFLHDAVMQVGDLTAAIVSATSPEGPLGVALTEAEITTIVDEANDIGEAAEKIF